MLNIVPSVAQLVESGQRLHQQGRLPEAEAAYRQALMCQPEHAEAMHYLGLLLAATRRMPQGLPLLARSAALQPGNAVYFCNYGDALRRAGRFTEAVAACRHAAELSPGLAAAHHNLGMALDAIGARTDAADSFRKALAINPAEVETLLNLGISLLKARQFRDALAALQRAAELAPEDARAHINLGNAWRELDELDNALASFKAACALAPADPEATASLALILRESGQQEEALLQYRKAMSLSPAPSPTMHDALIMTMQFAESCDARMLYREVRAWRDAHARTFEEHAPSHTNDRDPERLLRIGYVSSDFKTHVAAPFIALLFAAHNRAQVKVFCYSSVDEPDDTTRAIQAMADHWCNAAGLPDDVLVRRMQEDRVDIAVDLNLHSPGNRLLALARKPAPVQVCWLGYPGTTGLDSIDYRLSDPWLDPPGSDHSVYREQTILLPQTYWCYRPQRTDIDVTPLPAEARGVVTFGCLNNFSKVTSGALRAWRNILQQVTGSKLVLHAPPGSPRHRIESFMAEEGIHRERVEFVGRLPLLEYLRTYQRIDVALDPFPWAGGATTCDALWMGVPVVTLAGQRCAGRGGVSLLSNTGLPELIGSDVPHYVRIATDLARDVPRLSELRRTLRDRFSASPVMAEARFTKALEEAFRDMWRRWCRGQGG